jgi:hypothetical protein
VPAHNAASQRASAKHRKLDANQIRAITTTGKNNMPTFRGIYDVNQIRDVSEHIVQQLGAKAR